MKKLTIFLISTHANYYLFFGSVTGVIKFISASDKTAWSHWSGILGFFTLAISGLSYFAFNEFYTLEEKEPKISVVLEKD